MENRFKVWLGHTGEAMMNKEGELVRSVSLKVPEWPKQMYTGSDGQEREGYRSLWLNNCSPQLVDQLQQKSEESGRRPFEVVVSQGAITKAFSNAETWGGAAPQEWMMSWRWVGFADDLTVWHATVTPDRSPPDPSPAAPAHHNDQPTYQDGMRWGNCLNVVSRLHAGSMSGKLTEPQRQARRELIEADLRWFFALEQWPQDVEEEPQPMTEEEVAELFPEPEA